MTNAWHRSAPEGCRKCGRRDERHYARGLCFPCYDWEHKHGDIHRYPAMPLGQRPTNSWADSPRHATLARCRAERIARREARLLAIWYTDGPLIPPSAMAPLPAPPPLPNLRTHRGGITLPAGGATRRAA